MDVGQRPRCDNHCHVPKNEALNGVGPDRDSEGQQGKRIVDNHRSEEKAAAGTQIDVWKCIGPKGRGRRDVWVWISEVRIRNVWVERRGVSILGVAQVDFGALWREVGKLDVISRVPHARAGDADEALVAAARRVSRVEPGLKEAGEAGRAHGARQVGAGIVKGVGRILVVEVDKGLLQQNAGGHRLADGLRQLQLRGDLGGLERRRQRQAVGLDVDDEVVDVDPCRDGDDGEGDEDGGEDKRCELLSDGDSHFQRAMKGSESAGRQGSMHGILLCSGTAATIVPCATCLPVCWSGREWRFAGEPMTGAMQIPPAVQLRCVWKTGFSPWPFSPVASLSLVRFGRAAGVVLAGRCRKKKSVYGSILSCRCFNCVENANAPCLGCSCCKPARDEKRWPEGSALLLVRGSRRATETLDLETGNRAWNFR